jgi:hypothetical protein
VGAVQSSAVQQTKEKQNIRSTHEDPDTKPNSSNEGAAMATTIAKTLS